MRLMGLDVGSKTVGVAISDPMGWTAQGIEIVKIDEANGEFGLARIAELVKQYEVEKFVLGLPKNMDNSIGFRAEASIAYGKLLEKELGLPVDYVDESLALLVLPNWLSSTKSRSLCSACRKIWITASGFGRKLPLPTESCLKKS